MKEWTKAASPDLANELIYWITAMFREAHVFFFSRRRRHTRFSRDWSSDVCSSDLEQVRTYRVAQILDVELVGRRFERPDGFELAAYWRCYLADFEVRRHRGSAELRLSTRGAERLAHLMDPAVAAAAERNAVPDGDGWVRTRIPIETSEHALGELLRLGADVEVLGPPELRRRMVTVAAALVRVYGAEPAGDMRSGVRPTGTSMRQVR